MSVLLNNQELGALYGQVPELWQFYIVLKKFMDYRNGIVGIERGISWQSLREEMFVEPGPGLVGAGTPAKSKIRRLAERAQNQGLIVDRSDPKKLIFFMVLASTDESAKNKPGTNSAQSRHTFPAQQEPNNGKAYEQINGKTRHDELSAELLEPGTPPLSVYPLEDSEAIASGADAPAGDPKTAIWNLGEQYLGSRALVGKLVKQYGEAPVFHAIAQTATHGAADPAAYIHGLLRANGHGKSGAHRESESEQRGRFIRETIERGKRAVAEELGLGSV